MGIGSSPLEIADLDKFAGFSHLTSVYIGEAFKWSSFARLLVTCPVLADLRVDKINEHWCGKPPNLMITCAMVAELDKSVKENCSSPLILKNLTFQWLDIEDSLVMAKMVNIFPQIKTFSGLALTAQQIELIQGKTIVICVCVLFTSDKKCCQHD